LVRWYPRNFRRDVPVDVHDHAVIIEENGEIACRRIPLRNPAHDAPAMEYAVSIGLTELLTQLGLGGRAEDDGINDGAGIDCRLGLRRNRMRTSRDEENEKQRNPESDLPRVPGD
jgi:hypothetical protein